jgi:thioredoxin 1
MSVQKIQFADSNFDDATGRGLCVVCFEEPNDHDCRRQVRVIEKAAGKIAADITFGACDIEQCSKLAQRFRITSIPTTIIFKDGQELERLVGFRHERTFVRHFHADAAR